MADERIPRDWLQRQATLEELERTNLVDGRPFGYENETWEVMKGNLREGDEFWLFCSSPETWDAFPRQGMEGVALVRRGEVIDILLTAIS